MARRLYAATRPRYGWAADHRFGQLPIPNAPLDDLPAFWAERRLLAHADRVPSDLAARVERLSRRLGDLLPQAPRASLLHGDLWTGDVMAREGWVRGLIAPACCYGDAEADLAMLCLFASPPSVFWEACGKTAAGLGDRRPVYQLWPNTSRVSSYRYKLVP